MNKLEPINNYPITLNVLVEETINTVYYLENQSFFKQDISSLNKSIFEENGIIVIYEDYVRIENSLFTQNITFNMIKDFISESNVWNLLLKNNEKIKLTFNHNTSNLDTIFSELNKKINHINMRLCSVSCNVHFNKNLLNLLGYLAKIKGNLNNNNYTITEYMNLDVFDTHLKLYNDNLELTLPYDRFKDLKQSKNNLELIFRDNAILQLKDLPENQVFEMAELIIRKIINPPEYKDNYLYAMPPSNQLNNYPNQTQAPITQQQSLNQYSNYNVNKPPLNKKSKIIGLLLNMLIVGLGYAYVGKWGEGLVLLVIYTILVSLGIFLSFIGIGLILLFVALILWIYTLFRTNSMINKYNAGLPY